MKRLAVAAVVAAAVVGMAMAAGAATTVNNWCTSTYTLTGGSTTATGLDSATVMVLSAPTISILKYALNQRTGIESRVQVVAVSGDSIVYRIYWSNTGEATADTLVLNDYLPGLVTYGSIPAGDTIINGTKISLTYNGGLVQYTAYGVGGTYTAAGSGLFRINARVN